MIFKCDLCALCCKNIEKIEELKEFNRGDGVCKYLDEEKNVCKIYENRPLICNVEKFYEKFLKEKITKKEWYEMNYEVCKKLKGE